jgi:imidazoleglycerol-phosphate dehydratase
MAKVKLQRKTNETDVSLTLNLHGTGKHDITTGIGFFDHMLQQFSFHGCFDLELKCKGDLHVCGHHTVEDVGIVLGQAFKQGLPDHKNIIRYATAFVPMDETLGMGVVDISGRACLVFESEFAQAKVGEFDTELVREFFRAFVNHAQITLHLKIWYGENTHHKIEALFKAAAIGLRQALQIDAKRSGVSSTKGML